MNLRNIELVTPAGSRACLTFSYRTPRRPAPGLPGLDVQPARWIHTTDATSTAALVAHYGDGLADVIIEGDPDIAIDSVGCPVVGATQTWLDGDGSASPFPLQVCDVRFDAAGAEVGRREPRDERGNIQAGVFMTAGRMSLAEMVSGYVVSKTLQVLAEDAAGHAWCHALARRLSDARAVTLCTAAAGEPLVLQTGGRPYRGYLEGRVDGERWKLLLHLSAQELRTPEGW